MKRLFFIIPILLVVAVGCSTFSGIIGKSSNALKKQDDKITAVNNQISQTHENAITQISSLSYGTGYALDKVTNPDEPAIIAATKLNERIQSLAGLPDLEEQKAMTALVEDLISNNIAGKIALDQKDTEISAIQNEEALLVKTKDKAINDQLALSQTIALKADTEAASLQKYQGWFGLSAVFMGLKQFIMTSMWFIVGIGGLFLILRLLSATNPIAGAIYGLVDTLFSWVISSIKVIAPKAFAIAGTVFAAALNDAQSALGKVVDSIETVKLQSAASGKPATIEDLLNTAEANMSITDKAIIDNIKVQMGWTKPTTVSTVMPISSTPVVTIPTVAPITPTVSITPVIPASTIPSITAP